MTTLFQERAPAKVNLALQITGRRDDGYHLLDSLISFITLEDTVFATESSGLTLSVEGDFGAGLASDDNLVLRAARLLQHHAGGQDRGAAMVLQKQIPVGAGLGGGSADAAATLRLLNRMWGCAASQNDLRLLASKLGADVPSCVDGMTARMQSIGDQLTVLPPLPGSLWILVVHPGAPLATPDVYRSGKATFSGSLARVPDAPESWVPAIVQSRNDLLPAAASILPAVPEMLDTLSQSQEALAVRMSGSGSACFALFDDERAARMAERHFRARQPSAWARLCRPIHGYAN